jgi:hypothetical protein
MIKVLTGTFLLLLLAALATPAHTQRIDEGGPHEPALPERFMATVVGSSVPSGDALEVVVERWSTSAEHVALVGAINDHRNTVLSLLRNVGERVGYIRSPDSRIPVDLKYAAQNSDEGTRQVILVSDLPVPSLGGRSYLDPNTPFFTGIELRLGGKTTGEGRMVVKGRLVVDKRQAVGFEMVEAQPVRLMNVFKR